MKSLNYLIILLIFTSLIACEQESENDEIVDEDYSSQIVQEPATGKIESKAFIYESGKAYVSDTQLIIKLYDTTFTNPCGYSNSPNQFVYIIVPKGTGSYKVTAPEGYVVYRTPSIDLIDDVAEITNVAWGHVNITTFDTINKKVKGSLIGIFDNNNKINGTFDVYFCQGYK